MGILVELNLFGRDYEQEMRPLIKAFLPGADFEVSHYEAEDEAMRTVVSRDSDPLLLHANAGNDFSFCMLLMEDWFRIRVYKKGELIGSADADDVVLGAGPGPAGRLDDCD